VLPKFPLAVGFLAALFAVATLFGAEAPTGRLTPWRVADALLWAGVAAASVVVLALYSRWLGGRGQPETPEVPAGRGEDRAA
jgi:hypothetical protein